MSRIKYVHVIELEDGDRNILPGKGKRSGSFMKIPTPENDREDFERVEWGRVDYWRLPEPMAKSEFKDWWNDCIEADEKPDPIPAVIDAMDAEEQEAAA